MQNETAELKKLLATAVEYIESLYGAMTDRIIENQALLEAGKALVPGFEVHYKNLLDGPSSDGIRQKRSFGYVPLSEVSRLLKQ